jgi:hypothetical protein
MPDVQTSERGEAVKYYEDALNATQWLNQQCTDPKGATHSPFCACFLGAVGEMKMSDCDCGATEKRK